MSALPTEVFGMTMALAVGLLIGIERERKKGEGSERGAAGVRTFMLIALCGAVAQRVGEFGLAIGAVFVALAALASYRRSQEEDPGLTTEVAMLLTYFLGVLSMSDLRLAAALGVIVAIVLASKSRLHRFTRQTLTAQEMHDGLLLAAAAVVVLPLLPDRMIDPLQTLNPHRLWALVVIVMAINAAGYVALRTLGPNHGMVLAGLAGGFVSSTATIAAMGERARATPTLLPLCVRAALLSNIATLIQLAIVIGVLSISLLQQLAIPLLASAVVATLAALLAKTTNLSNEAPDAIALGRPFEPRRALGFVALMAAILTIGAAVHHLLGDLGLQIATAVSGFADVHAAAASIAQLTASSALSPHSATLMIAMALLTNSISKLTFAFVQGGRAYGQRLVPGIALMVLAFFGSAWWLAAMKSMAHLP